MKKKASSKAKPDQVDQLQDKPTKFLIVGIGASAGGVQALQEFFRHVPQNSGMAYVVILHLSPDHDSQLAAILQRESSIPVSQVTEKTTIQPDHIYVVPPDRHLSMEDGHITVAHNLYMEERRAPVDIFFRTLADQHGPRTIAVVLSGTGANGSMGLKRIKERGGATYVQNPREAEFNEMPRNSIATGLVDEVLNVAEIPARIIAFRDSIGKVEIVVEPEHRPEEQQQALRETFTLLRQRTGHDFSNYKRPTLLRRIERRINVRGLADLPAYARYLNDSPDETVALLKDLLISVTNFFRDGKAFDTLEHEIIPALLKEKRGANHVRIWVAGCATGEEAYSIGMLFLERTMGLIEAPKIQIFATDIDESAIAQAREGYYTINDLADVSAERLRRFFNKDGDGYRVRRELRELVMFALHNFLKDPPFSHIDLVSCRNVMIYLNNVAQERVAETFHFALEPGGYLFIGSSESVDGATDLYATANREYHIFQSRHVGPRSYPLPDSVPTNYFDKPKTNQPPTAVGKSSERISFGELHQQLLEEYAPPSLVLNEEYEIVHLTEKAGNYLQMGGGEPSKNLLKLVKPEIRLELRSALYQAIQRQAPVATKGLRVVINERPEIVNIHVRPVLSAADTSKGFILVVFEPGSNEGAKMPDVMLASDEPVARQLEEELTRMRVQLRASNEQHEFQAEELKASNEELQAINEELRSAAEELETSKEELQSINEELRTVNQELKVKIEETSTSSNNLQNLINSTNLGTIFLDRSLRVVLFTPSVRDIFNLRSADYGRPLSDITGTLDYANLLQDAETVIERLTEFETEVTTKNGGTYLMRITPYRTDEDRIKGVVITFLDITKRKQAEKDLKHSQQHLKLIVESAKDFAIFTLDTTRRISNWSSGAENIFGYSEQEAVGHTGDMLFVPEDRESGVPEKELSTAAQQGRADNERWHLRKDGSRFWGSGVTHPLTDEAGKLVGFVKIMRDLTAARRLEEAKVFLASIVESSHDSVITINFQREITSWNKAAEQLYGYTAEEAIGKTLEMLTLPGDFSGILHKIDDIQHNREVVVFDTVRQDKTGELKELEVVMSPVINDAGNVIGVSTIARDVSERKRREANLAFLAKINLEFAPLLSMQEVFTQVGPLLASYLKLSRCHFTIINDAQDQAVLLYDFRNDLSLPEFPSIHRISDYLTPEGREHYRAGTLTIVNAGEISPFLKGSTARLSNLGFASLVDVPHLEGGEWRFLVTAGRSEGSEWRSDELELLKELTSKIYSRIERARAEEALRVNENRLQSMVNVPKVGVINFDSSGLLLHGNDAFLQMVGYTQQDLVEKPMSWRDFTPPEHLEISEEIWKSLQQTGRGGPYEREYYRKNGSKIWLMFVAARLEDETIVEYVIDISNRKNAEAALRQSETRIRTLANAVPQIIWSNNVEGRAEYFNQRWYEYSGLTEQESSGPGWQVIVHPDDALRSKERWAQSLAAGQIFDAEFRLRRKDGAYKWFICRNVPLKDESGVVKGWFGSATDIDSLKKAEEALTQSEARLRITMESATDYAIITMDTDRIVEKWSHGASLLFGYSEDEIKGKTADLIFTEEDRIAGIPQKEMETARDQGFAPDDRWHQRKDGTRFFVNGVMRPIQHRGLTGYVKVMRDMTQQQKFTEELHRLVAERTRDLERSNADLMQFAHVTSHDLKEPVRKIKIFNTLLAEEFSESMPPEARSYIDKISRSVARITAMIEATLNYSRIGISELMDETVDLDRVLDEIQSDLELYMVEKNATLLRPLLPKVKGNTTLLHQLFYNLLSNSLKFSKKETPLIVEITCNTIVLENTPFLQIVFADNGIGFEAEYSESIFEVFSRLHPKDSFEGTGLGLALCKKIVERHHGRIYATSKPGQGARFTIELPA